MSLKTFIKDTPEKNRYETDKLGSECHSALTSGMAEE